MSDNNKGLEAARPLFKAWGDAVKSLLNSEEFWASPEMVKAKAHSAANERLLDEVFAHANYPKPETTEDWRTLAGLLGVTPGVNEEHGMLDYINAIVAELRRRHGSPPVNRPRKRRRQSATKIAPLTTEQAEAMHLVGEHKGNVTTAAKAAGKTRQAMKKLYDKALKKLGQTAAKKPQTKPLRTDRRGQDDLSGSDDRRK